MRISYVFVAIAATLLACSDALGVSHRSLRTENAADADFEERGAPSNKVEALA
ncbi:uncharacterized protein PITG_22768 [Phytophthora infestans T30-4]|uniref:RxLR effector protein n=1 Tax=Phytophthora infestans (strain T30-4) TaxID=403677 RepID=D0N5S1_PHYIT|nr:uncharacterized protein PITG_22768 [Phytophthora infestans T30-4]EEY70412.1 hypothetical protein PITG_22768 [Phytophthora infestans T30-4]|eukprot:XP_002998066.1 hypothetical protein PITG_22768 [Phytophthora infestans T30-4]